MGSPMMSSPTNAMVVKVSPWRQSGWSWAEVSDQVVAAATRRRSRGSHYKPATVVVLGAYSSPTQPA